jgi:hypothetical protein
MSVFGNLFTAGKRSKSASTGPETAPVRMDLDERMEFRREMLYEAIRFTMQTHGILSASYRFRVVRNDRRGHMYSVMMDLSTDFMHKREGRPAQLVVLGTAMGKNAATRYGLLVSGVYWRVNEEIQGFESSRPAAEPGASAATPDLPASGRASAEELAAFGDAWHQGEALRFRGRVYASDLAPLGR